MNFKIIFFFLIGLSFSNCEDSGKPKIVTSKKEDINNPVVQLEPTPFFDTENHYNNYKNLKYRITKLKSKVNQNNNSSEKLTQGKELLANVLVDSIFNYWYGTTWEFNGHTKTPRNGEIACGYFITTTMKDVGVSLNRFKLAQKASSEIIKKLCKSETIKMFSNLDKLKNYLSDVKNNEVLILGLDYHVGFVVKRNGKNYFIHSNYISSEGVIKEDLETSDAIRSSNIYMIGNVSRNDELILEWLN